MAAQTIILATSKPSAATWTTLYTAPTGRRARVIVSAVNQDATTVSEVRVALSDDGAAIADEQWVHIQDLAALTGSEKVVIVSASDVIRVYTENATVSFVANGLEEDVPT